MGIQIITDSASDISQRRAREWGITVMPLIVRFHEEEYLDGVTLTPYQFYEKLVETDEIPKTSQITPFTYEEVFKKAVDAGDKVICFCLSSGVSGSYQSACIASENYKNDVAVIDTKQFCISEFIIVQRAVQMRDQGLGFEEIVSKISEELKEAHVIAVFDTLEYLKLGGRISAAAAAIGNVLSLKPVLTIEDGVVKILGKARGSKKSGNMLTQFISELGGIDFSRPLCLAYSGFDDSILQKYVKDSAEIYAGHESALQTAYVGATIGTYAGPGAIAVAFFSAK
ncbi:MAG: DegV family protein [Lachnospiraceae bacterium]|nr:DegV family protein [Lachnospiraceae bacterium]